jgi:hypothetical protein
LLSLSLFLSLLSVSIDSLLGSVLILPEIIVFDSPFFNNNDWIYNAVGMEGTFASSVGGFES